MATKYIARKPPKNEPPQNILVILKKGISITEQINEVASALKNACPEIFKKKDPYPTIRLVKFKEGEITYEITEGKGSRAKVGCI